MSFSIRPKLPPWLHVKLQPSKELEETYTLLSQHATHTVCQSAKCPNRYECFSKKTATFLALGPYCTRLCSFCAVPFQKEPPPPNSKEYEAILASIEMLKLEHVVITMTSRDDLPDGGANYIATLTQLIAQQFPHVTIEVLVSDFQGDKEVWRSFLQKAHFHIFNHNIETVQRLSSQCRMRALYETSLSFLSFVKKLVPEKIVKSGCMLGLGETIEEVELLLEDLQAAGVDIVTIGQYLQPSKKQRKVASYIEPQTFSMLETYGKKKGIPFIFAGPFVRSSYNAEAVFNTFLNREVKR